MVAPEGKPQLRQLKRADLPLGSSGKTQNTILADQSATLGASGESITTKFDAPVSGKYEFLLYDAQSNLVGKEYFDVFANSGTLTLAFNDGRTFLDFYATAGINFNYSTTNPNPEKITLYLPPGYIFVSNPNTTPQYTVKSLGEVPLPVDFYTDPAADIMKRPENAHLTKVQALELTLKQGGTQSLLFSFSIKFSGSNTAKNILTALMLAYGENPETIPHIIGANATSLDGSETFAHATIDSVSDIVRGSGRSEAFLSFPHQSGGL